MRYYGNDPCPTGSQDAHKPIQHGSTFPAYVPQGRPVLRIQGDLVTRYPSVSAAAHAACVRQATMTAWIRDGREKLGYRWVFENKEEP